MVEVLSVRVAVWAWEEPEKVSCPALNALVPGGAPKSVNVTVPVKPFLGVSVKS